MAEQPKEPVNTIRRNVALASVAVVGMGSVGGLTYFAGTVVRDQKRRDMVPAAAAKLVDGVNKGDFGITGGALSEAKRYGILNEVVNAMAPNTALVEEVSTGNNAAEDKEMRARFHLKNFRSAVDMRSSAQAYAALSDARREQALESMVDQISIVLAQDRPR